MPFVPLQRDVREARAITASLGFPAELVLLILDYARYWAEVTHQSVVHDVLLDEEWSTQFSAASIYLWAKPPEPDSRFKDEKPKIKEIDFTIVSHDQGWTTEDAEDSYDTSSWFEVSIFRHETPERPFPFEVHEDDKWTNLELARKFYSKRHGWHMVARPSTRMEPQRLHCEEMRNIMWNAEALKHWKEIHDQPGRISLSSSTKRLQQLETIDEKDEGRYSWYLQGNQVARGTSVFEGEMVKRYRVTWGSYDDADSKGNADAGKGDGFVDSLQKGDTIAVWSRAKRRGWENHVYGARMTFRYTI